VPRKQCAGCGVFFPASGEFFYQYNTRGGTLTSKCKECIKAAVKARYESDPEKIRAYEASRARLPHRKNAATLYQREHREETNETKRRWYARNKEKKAANVKVKRAVDAGRLVRQPCEVCGVSETQAHHDNYSKPLEVRWLCTKHHGEHHADNNIHLSDFNWRPQTGLRH
jgi:hypothetical protein